MKRETGVWSILDGLRFFFALWVLIDHTHNFSPPGRGVPLFNLSGLTPVLCFFVISGFSIHHSVLSAPRGYYRRRFWRIVPINALAVAIGWFAYSALGIRSDFVTPEPSDSILNWLGCLLLLQSLLPVAVGALFPAWSLSIEAFYYLWAPALRGRHTFTVVIAAASAVTFMLWPSIKDEYIAIQSYGIAIAALAWAWLAGWIALNHQRRHREMFVTAFGACGAFCMYTQARWFGITDLASGASSLLAWLATLLVVFYQPQMMPNRVLEYLGEISYPLYLLHYPVLFVLTGTILATYPDMNYGYVQVVVATIAAVLAYHFVDRPLRRTQSVSTPIRSSPVARANS